MSSSPSSTARTQPPFQTDPPLHKFPLSTITALHGADAFERAFSIVTQPRVVCINFRPRSASLTSPPPSLPSSPISETNVQESDPPELEDPGRPNDAYRADGEWVVLDMLDDHGESFHSPKCAHTIKPFQPFPVFSASFTVKLLTSYRRPLSPRPPSSPFPLPHRRSRHMTQLPIPNGASIPLKTHAKPAWEMSAKPWSGCSGPTRLLGNPRWIFATIAKLSRRQRSTRSQTFTLTTKVMTRARWSGKVG